MRFIKTQQTTIQIIMVMFLWTICYPLIIMGIAYSPHLSFAAMRAVIAGMALLLLAWFAGHAPPRGRRIWMKLIGTGIGATTLGFFGMFHAAEYVSPGLATVITNTQPLMAAVLAHLFLRERLSTSARWGLSVGFLGIVLITLPNMSEDNMNHHYLLGVAYITLAAFGITVGNVLMKRIAGTLNALTAMGWQLLLGSIPLWTMAFFWEDPARIQWTGFFILSLLGLALFGTSLAYWLWFRVLQHTPLTRANVYTFLVPMFGLTLGVVFFNESVSIWTIAGGILTLCGIYLVHKARYGDDDDDGWASA